MEIFYYGKEKIRSAEVINILLNYGITERKSYTAIASDKLIDSVHFWRGAIDGDGSVNLRATEVYLCGVSISFLNQFRDFVAKQGYFSSFFKDKNGVCRIYVRNKQFIIDLYKNAPVALDRKAQRGLSRDSQPLFEQ